MKYLPEELLINILLRLPVKSLLRFKSVCKLWLSLISDPSFANSHFQRSSLFPDRLLHISDSQIRSIDFHSPFSDDSAVLQLSSPIITRPHYLPIWGSCRGFVLLDDYHDFFVWNPSTGSYKRVPYFPMSSQFSPFTYGLGYDASNDDYLVVLAATDPSNANFTSHFLFFSMKTNSWKKIEGSTDFPYMNVVEDSHSTGGAFLNGAIHWLASRHDTSVEVILAFNVTEKNFMEIPLADDFYGNLDLGISFICTLGECLSLCSLVYDTADIWLMKEYGIKSSWTKSIVVPLDQIPTDFFIPIGLTQSGEIVGSDSWIRLLKCNGEGEVVDHRSYTGKGYEAVTYTETLLSLPCDNEEVSEGDRQQ